MKRILLFISIAVLFSSCEDYLDKIPEAEGMPPEEVFSDYLNFRKFADRMYRDMHNYLGQGDYTYIAALCEEGWLGPGWETMPTAQSGDWLTSFGQGQALQFYGIWNSWRSIRQANQVLANLYQLEESGNATPDQIDQLKGQAHFMRAWYYYEFLKRQGGMPYITEVFEPSDDFARTRLSYHETALKIAADCDTAFSLLPIRWDAANIGRPEKGSALALKAAALLIPASPQYNPGNEAGRWQETAQAALDVIEFAETTRRYSLLQGTGTNEVTYMTPDGIETIEYPSGFDSIFLYLPFNDEILWENYGAINSNMYNVFASTNLAPGGVIQGFSVTANIADRFETANGLAIKDDAAFDWQNPYVDRDPRFYHSILFNQQRWTSDSDRYLELWKGGEERKAQEQMNRSGYMARKFWAPGRDQWSGTTNPFNHAIYFRLAEMYLIYAEAANELGGPDHTISGANLTAVEAVNLVRARVEMPPVNNIYLNQADFRERIKNERAVELFLEGKRLFDLMRWGDAHKTEHRMLYSVEFVPNDAQPTGFDISRSESPFFTLTFTERQYSWPVPISDATMFEEFQQNPGW